MARRTPTQASRPSPGRTALAVAGIGASAGGLKALEAFLAQVPAASGMAFVVVQHLDPTHEAILAELLQRATPMPVVQAQEGMRIQADRVYVIPPNRDLALVQGCLRLFEPIPPRGLRLPIDFFFRSLALEAGAGALGVVLSGMGADGTEGLRAIKEAEGLAFVQAPATATFDDMPRSAIEAGLADLVASPGELGARVRDPQFAPRPLPVREGGALDQVLALLRARTGQDFTQYKRPTLLRRIERRMGIHRMGRLGTYAHFLRDNPGEVDLLFQELLIGVTRFFRDPEAWDCLRDEALPALLATYPQGADLRAWTPGCATGEEAYSLAMVFREAADRFPNRPFSLTLFATDLDRNAVERGRQGLYSAQAAADVSAERLERFFVKEGQGYRVGKEVRERVIFAPQNLGMDPPFTRLDLITCRNLLIYLETGLQRRLMPLFHYALRPGGLLFLGNAESIGPFSELFAVVDRQHRIYRSRAGLRRPALDFPSRDARPAEAPRAPEAPPSLKTLTEQFLLQRHVPSAILVSAEGDLLFTTGRTGKYLEPAVGKANLNLFAMAREGLAAALSEAFHGALREQRPVSLHNVKVGTEGGTLGVDVRVEPLLEPEPLKGKVIVIFSEAPAPEPPGPPGGRRERALQQELAASREEMRTSREELRSINEELQSINEELQTTNEELTTSKEEMQSMNEELQTVNLELQAKLDELSTVNGDLRNLLNSTDIATLFLDEGCRVRRFTPQAAALIRLQPGDLGRPISDITTVLRYPELTADARAVLETLAFQERRVPAEDGRWFNVRTMPYRTPENRISGVVITFTDVTSTHTLELALREAQADLARLREGP